MNPDKKLQELYITFSEPATLPQGVTHAVKSGKLLFVGGVLPFVDGKLLSKGRLGIEVTIDGGRNASKAACVCALAIIAKECGGTLNNVKRIIKVDGFIASGADFVDHTKVMEGAGDLLRIVFGDSATHARTLMGVTSLPLNACLQLSMIVELK